MSTKKQREGFERLGKQFALDMRRGLYGELLDAHTRECWTFFYVGWYQHASHARKRKARS